MFNGKSKFFLKKTNITEMTWCPYGGEKKETWDFPSGPVDTNLPASSGNMGLTPGLGWSHMPQSS